MTTSIANLCLRSSSTDDVEDKLLSQTELSPRKREKLVT